MNSSPDSVTERRLILPLNSRSTVAAATESALESPPGFKKAGLGSSVAPRLMRGHAEQSAQAQDTEHLSRSALFDLKTFARCFSNDFEIIEFLVAPPFHAISPAR
jgi:hypothetical protein